MRDFPLWLIRAATSLLALGAFGGAQAAQSPDWVKAALAEADPSWRPENSAIQLLNSTQIRFLSPERLLETVRGIRSIHTEAGLNAAMIGFGYDPNNDRIISASAWTTSADGQKTRSFSRSDFIDQVMHYNQYFWDSERVLEFAAGDKLEMNGTLAWEFQIERNPGFDGCSNSFLPSLPTWRETFEVIPAPGMQLQWYSETEALRHPSRGTEPGILRWETMRQRPLPAERPDNFLANPLTVFARCALETPDTWPQFAAKAAEIMEPRVDSTGAVKAATEAAVAGQTGRWARIRALTEFVQKQIVYLAISLDKDNLAGYRPHPAAEVLRTRYGDCKDKATLLVSMLRAIGEDARIVLLYSGDPRTVEADWPAAEFNHAIVAIPGESPAPGWPAVQTANGNFVIFDPTDSTTPLGVLPVSDQGGYALIVAARDGALIRLPMADPAQSRLARTIDAKLDPVGILSAAVTEDRFGSAAANEYRDRSVLTWEGFQQRVERRVHQNNPLFDGFTLKERWEPGAAEYRLDFAFSVHAYGRQLGSGMMLVSPAILPGTARFGLWKLPQDGVSCLGPDTVDEQVKIALPEGFAVEEIPDPWSEKVSAASGQLDYASDGHVLTYHSHLVRRAGFYGRADYEALRLLYQHLHDAQRRPVLFRHGAPGT